MKQEAAEVSRMRHRLNRRRSWRRARQIGSSTSPAHQMVEAQWAAERRGLERFVCEQPPYSPLVRGIEADVLPVAEQYGMGVIVWSPLAGGWLSGRYRKGQDLPQTRRAQRLPDRYDMTREVNQRKLDAVERLAVLAEEAGITLVELSIAFTIRHRAVTSAIIGPRTMEHLEGQLAATEVRLSDDVLDRIDEIVPPGVTLNPADAGWQPPQLSGPSLRRRP
ncbi:aldo/keto reductase [Nonomuraea sp. H19]|uniref:aldo/keto reductase n=1 Tax=Nonomuraea sp. H19 TaxID=3452206 RepID=UPI003F8A56C3